MSDDTVAARNGFTISVKELLAQAAAAESRVHGDLAGAIDDFFLPRAARLDERIRAELSRLLAAIIAAIEAEIRSHAEPLLQASGAKGLDVSPEASGVVLARLSQSRLLRDPGLMAELLARVRLEALGRGLPMQASDDPERASLINRYVQHPDGLLASGAMAVLIAESRRRTGIESGRLTSTELPAELHHKLAWWVAATLRGSSAEPDDAVDSILSDATRRTLMAYDEGARLEASALRFAAAVHAPSDALGGLLGEALGDRRPVLFVAFLAHALGIPYPLVRDMVLDPGGERLWLALRAADLPREAVARIGYALSEGDPRRDLGRFADALDGIAAIPAQVARGALASLRLDAEYRAALMALERAGGEA